MKLQAVIYHGPDADLTLPIRILKEEGIRWTIVEDVPTMMKKGKGLVNPRGWFVWLPDFNVGAGRWTGIYHMLSERGLLYC
jgi:hypothetical protein